MLNIKADISPLYASELKKELLGKNINPKNREFEAYSYIIGQLSDTPKNQTGALDKNTIAAMTDAEK